MSTVLIVEDSLVERKALTMSLNQGGFQVLTAKSGEEAKEKVNNCQPDVIILDVMLPGSSGFEICRQFKADPQTNKIPVIFCSSKATELDKFWGLKQGASAYLTKPFVSDELIQVINDLIKSRV